MSQVDIAWGEGASERYEEIAARFRPIFDDIRKTAIDRELQRQLPQAEIDRLKVAGFGALRLREDEGGSELTLPEFFNLLIELSEADSNITQALRGHFGFAEDLVNQPNSASRQKWAQRLVSGDIAGNAWTEIGSARQDLFSTAVTKQGDDYRVNGQKFYTTGSLFADWINVGVVDHQNRLGVALVRRDDVGVDVIDDWDGFGQRLTASGTAHFRAAAVDADDLYPDETLFRYGAAFYQAVHLATLAGIGRAISGEVAALVASRTRNYSNAAATRSSQDPQVLEIVGRIRSNAYSAGAIVLQVARSIERAYQAHFQNDAEVEDHANAVAELETSQALTVVSNLILDASNIAFDALGASATRKSTGLDRHWRNARTLTSHNPRIYKARIIGDYAVNGTPPPYQWRIGSVG